MRRLTDLWSLGLSYILPYRPMRGGPGVIEREYLAGEWDYLRGETELPRFSLVAGYASHFKPGGSILELGCGEGVLYERLCKAGYSTYVGVDIAPEAIRRAQTLEPVRSSFFVGDAASYEPGADFDVIIFNECLEYFENPRDVVKRYERFLSPGGIFIVSMFVGVDTRRASVIWKQLEQAFSIVAESRVTTKPRLSWTVKVLAPAAS